MSQSDRPGTATPTRRHLLATGAAVVFAGADARASGATAPVVQHYICPPVGARWALRAEGTGVFAAGPKSQSMERLADRDFLGDRYIATTNGTDVFLLTADGAGVAILRNDEPLIRYLEPVPYYNWPMRVGAHWTGQQRSVSFARPEIRTEPFESTVQAWETIVLPAGSFDAFRIVSRIGTARAQRWWSPSIGVTVKIVTDIRNSDGKEGRNVLELTSYQARP